MIFAKQKSEAHYSLFYSFLTLIQFALNRFLNIADFYWKRMRGDQAESFPWDMRRFAPSVMGPAALATGFAPSMMGPTLASSSAALATGLAAPPSHRLLSAIIGQRPRGATAPGHKPLSVVISHRLREPVTGPSALSSAVNSSCTVLAWEAFWLSGVIGRGKNKQLANESNTRRRQMTDDRRRQTTPCGVSE